MILDKIVEDKKLRLMEHKSRISESEMRALGEEAILLIAAILDDAQMNDFYELSKVLELDALVETHDDCSRNRSS